MEGDESDQFASADEGFGQAQLNKKLVNAVETNIGEEAFNSLNVQHDTINRASDIGVDKRIIDPQDQPRGFVGIEKKKRKKKKQRTHLPRKCADTEERTPVCQGSISDEIVPRDLLPCSPNEDTTCAIASVNPQTAPEGNSAKLDDTVKHDADRKHTIVPTLEPEISPDNQIPESNEASVGGIWDPDALSTAASSLIRNVGGGISSLAGVLGQVLSTSEPDEDVAERRRRRKAEEEKDLRTTLGAWSDVWNAAWGDNSEDTGGNCGDGWELDDSVLPVESQQQETQKEEPEEDLGTKSSLPTRDDAINSTANQSMEPWSWAGVSSFAHNLTTSFHEKSRSLVQGSVDVLEKIGRKTMSVLEENDPGFQYTRKFIRPHGLRDQPSLSQVIHEARERAKLQECLGGTDESRASQNRGDFNYQLEASRGLVHLEALELVSYQAESKLHTHPADASSLHDGCLETIWETLNFEDDEQLQKDLENDEFLNDEVKHLLRTDMDPNAVTNDDLPVLSRENVQLWIVLRRILTQLNIIYSGQKLIKILDSYLRNALSPKDEAVVAQEKFFTAISTLAEVTSGNLEYLHKLTECLLIHTHEPDTDFLQISQLIRLFLLISMKLKSKVCTECIGMVKKARNPPTAEESGGKPVSTSHLIASILLECGNAQNHLKNAARLLIPVLQLAYLTNQVGLDESPE